MLPALGLVVIVYAAVSFVLMTLFIFLSDGNTTSKVHLVLQVCLAGTAVILCAFLWLARSAASSGLSALPPGLPSPPILAAHIEQQEQRFKDMGTDGVPIAIELKKLRETIRYSLPRIGGIGSNDRYQTFSSKILSLCRTLEALDSLNQEFIEAQINSIRSLQREARFIADSLKK